MTEQHVEGSVSAAAPVVITPDQTGWDAFVATHSAGHLLQSSGWGALKARFGWTPHCYAVAAGGGIRAGALVLEKQRFGLSVLYVPRGPLFSGEAHIDELLLDHIIRIGRRRRAVFVRLEPNLAEHDPRAAAIHTWLIAYTMQPAAPIQPRSTIHLDLTPEPEHLLAGMSKGHRSDIKRAAREGVVVREGLPSDLGAFYAIMKETSTRAGFAIHTPDYYASILELFGDTVRLWLAERNGVTIAAAMIAVWGATAIYLYSGSTAEGLQYGAQHAIQWHAIRWARARGATQYDFWGIPDALGQAAASTDHAARARLEAEAEHDPLYGVYRFKKGFGGAPVRYLPAYDRVLIPLLYTIWQRRLGR